MKKKDEGDDNKHKNIFSMFSPCLNFDSGEHLKDKGSMTFTVYA